MRVLNMRTEQRTKMFTLIAILLSAALIGFVNAAPQGPNTINISSSGRNPANTAPVTVQAEAGNVTAVVIDGTKVTEAWQGYYGNITGTIVLDDANNATFYDWSLPDPTGEIYASNYSSVTWSNVYCINVSQNGTNPIRPGGIVSNINGSQIELNFGINATDLDGLNETFNATYTDTTGFKVGAITIDIDDGCSLAQLYTDESRDSGWEELLLTDNTSLIFTALIRDDADMYKTAGGETADFQMLVLENGHPGSESTTTSYYFYVELA
jgi:hypothetical protein